MFDIEKAKSRGLEPEQIEIMQKINENNLKLRFGGVSNVGVYREQRVSGLYRMSEM